MLHQSIYISGLKNYEQEKEIEQRKKKKIIVVNNFFCENNIFICDKIRDSIPNYSDKFEILTSAISLLSEYSDSSDSSDLSDSDFDLADSADSERRNKQELYLLEYQHNEEDLVGFFEIKKCIKKIIRLI